MRSIEPGRAVDLCGLRELGSSLAAFYTPGCRGPGGWGPLLAHPDPYFSTCYAQLEKQILTFDFGDEPTQIDRLSQWVPRGKDVSHARA